MVRGENKAEVLYSKGKYGLSVCLVGRIQSMEYWSVVLLFGIISKPSKALLGYSFIVVEKVLNCHTRVKIP
jgi:hypothetical protein